MCVQLEEIWSKSHSVQLQNLKFSPFFKIVYETAFQLSTRSLSARNSKQSLTKVFFVIGRKF